MAENKKVLERIWNEYAKAYLTAMPYVRVYKELLSRVMYNLKDCEIVLDSGCGPGILLAELSKEGKRVYGVDNNEKMIEYAKMHLSKVIEEEQIVSRKLLRCENISALSFPNDFFDGIANINVLYSAEDPERCLYETFRVTKKDGIAVFSGPKPDADFKTLAGIVEKEFLEDVNDQQILHNFEITNQCSRQLLQEGMKNPFSVSELASLLIKTGFRNIIEADETAYRGCSWFIKASKG